MKGEGKPNSHSRSMNHHSPQNAEFEAILGRFSSFIKMHLLKFNPGKYGLDLDDLGQEVRIKIWRVVSHEKRINNLPSYIKKIVDSTVIDHLRKVKRQEGIFQHEKEKNITEIKASYAPNILQEHDLREAISKAVDLLLESRGKAVRLFLLNMSIEEIAAFYNWTQDKTRNLLYRGLSDLREELKRSGIDYED
jgi:RNA polymerase sigma factor (sigma-70 family)